MPDTFISTDMAYDTARGMRNLVWVSALVGYVFYIAADFDFVYRKTTDGGKTWGAEVQVGPNDSDVAFDVWYDRWTPGDAGTRIHLWWFGQTLDDVLYRSIDTANADALSAQITVFAGVSATTGAGSHVSGTKARGGNLYCAFSIDNGAEVGTYRSVDAGATWGVRASLVEAAAGDWAMLFPGNEADNQDIWALYFDASANALTLKTHDDSADANAESATIATVAENVTDLAGQYPFSATIRHSDNHLLLAVLSEFDTVNAQHRAFDINGAAAIVEKTAIAAGDDHYYPSIFIHQASGEVYVAYNGRRNGQEALGDASGIYYVKSLDGMLTWNGEYRYSESGKWPFRQTWAAPMGERFLVAWRLSAMLMTNAESGVDFSSAVAPLAAFPAYPVLLFAGYAERPEPGVRRSEAEDLVAIQAATVTKAPVRRPVQYLLTSAADKDAFVAFVEGTLVRGTKWFNWTDPQDGFVKPARIVGGRVGWQALRKDLGRWRADFELETYR